MNLEYYTAKLPEKKVVKIFLEKFQSNRFLFFLAYSQTCYIIEKVILREVLHVEL